MKAKPNVLILGCNFAGLTVSRYLHQEAKDAIAKDWDWIDEE